MPHLQGHKRSKAERRLQQDRGGPGLPPLPQAPTVLASPSTQAGRQAALMPLHHSHEPTAEDSDPHQRVRQPAAEAGACGPRPVAVRAPKGWPLPAAPAGGWFSLQPSKAGGQYSQLGVGRLAADVHLAKPQRLEDQEDDGA